MDDDDLMWMALGRTIPEKTWWRRWLGRVFKFG